MCLACGMDDDDLELWRAYRDYLEKRGLGGFELMRAADATAMDVNVTGETVKPASTTFNCDET